MSDTENRTITAEDLYQLKLISGCQISPDGRQVVFCLHRVDQGSEKKYANIWVVPTDGDPARQFTVGDQVDAGPQWSPDGSQIAFLSNRGSEKQSQLHLIPFHGGEARPLTDLKGSIESFEWSPDGRRFICTFRKTDSEVLEREEDEKKKKLGVVSRHITRVLYKYDGVGFLPEERSHLWLIDAQTGEAQQLTDSDIHAEYDPSWSPDGQHVVFCSNRSDDPDFAPGAVDLFVMSVDDETANPENWRKIETPYGQVSMPVFSPDGHWLAYYGREGEADWWKHTHLWVVPADGQGPARDLTATFDRHVAQVTINDMGGGAQIPPTWSADSQMVYFPISHHGSTKLHAISIFADSPDLQTVIDKPGVVGAYTLDQSQTKLAYFQADMTSIGQIWLRDLASNEDRVLTTVNDDILNEIDLGTMEEVWFKATDGSDLQGWILTPPDFDPAKKYPSIMEIHGGPLAQYGNFFMHEFYALAAQGYVVYFSNPRGGHGYGEAHARAIWNDVGGADYDDLMAWADYLAQQPYIDTSRMGVTGGSYGGLMTNFIIGRSDRFAAAVTQRSIANRVNHVGTSDMNWMRKYTFGNEFPWENLENYWRQSPLKYIANAKTPTLIIHSEQDLRCPIEQGEQLFVALKVLGVETEMVRFPDESHGLSRIGRTDRRIIRLQHMLRWFDRYLK